ncbi:Inositol 1,3,4-trisphosphate 5/6-kinase family protein [Trifolium repens]|nr:Inositol 1,3,4-trisphosphate 5/6-kinase family protein [Trifolium repens]
MRLNGEISSGEEEEEEVIMEKSEVGTTPFLGQKLVVGYVLTAKKKKSFLQPNFIALARSKGLYFVAIDVNKPLTEQGPFDIVLHKLLGEEWRDIIEDFRQKHPEVIVLDPPDAIQHLHNRQSMLQDVADLNLSDCNGKVGIPRQLVITKDKSPSTIPYEVTKAGLKLPLVAKPLVVDGSAKSHELFLAYDEFSLSELEPPLVLQEFVNHGGLLFKIYIVGESIKVVRRFSLPNISKRELSKVSGVYRFPRVSCAAASADDADLDPSIAEHPPRPLLERLAKELRHRLGLRLFNVDMIREYGTKDVFYVIDINYFPGYGKMPDYEHVFTDFLLNLKQNKCKKKLTT